MNQCADSTGAYGNVGSVAQRMRFHARDVRAAIDASARLTRQLDGRLYVWLPANALALGEKAESLETIAYHLELMDIK